MTTPTLSELADIGAKAAQVCLLDEGDDTSKIVVRANHSCYTADTQAREAFAKAVLDAVGYKLPVDPEREAFDVWVAGLPGAVLEPYREQMFEAWKAGRAARDKEVMLDKQPNPETFEAHGHTWFKHTPGDPMPCDGNRKVNWLLSGETDEGKYLHWSKLAKDVKWRDSRFGVIGWRYADS